MDYFSKAFLFFVFYFGIAFELSSQSYFQQEVNYSIVVTLNDKVHELNAFERIEYINNSDDTLKFIFFHLWPNAYSGNNTDLAKQISLWKGKEKLFGDNNLKGFIDSLDFKVNSRQVNWMLLPDQPDICKLLLDEYLCPGDTIIISTPFHVKIPLGVTSRLGHIGESYQISQWYPKPAVYERSGWHQMPYLDQGEFYSEFGSFDVNITLPDNYTVGATGDLCNEEEVQRLDSLSYDLSWKTATPNQKDDFPPSTLNYKTLRYTGTDIHDFAWFADKRFHVQKGSVNLPYSGRELTTWVMFTNQQKELWKDALEYVNSSILYFSDKIGDYPYNSFTAVQSALNAGAGMEYPGITVIGLADDAYALDQVIAHEACHSWFYSSLASNERRYPYMDEGITSAYEMRYLNDRYPGKKLWELYFKKMKMVRFLHIENMPVQQIQELEWLGQARQSLEQPLNLPAPDYTYLNYGALIYSKSAIGFSYLRNYLGDTVFDNAIHEYYRLWKSRHPQPDDLRRVFESVTGKELDWFFTDFIGTTKRIDYKIIALNESKLKIRNLGESASPVMIAGIKGDKIIFQKWIDGFNGKKTIDVPPGDYSELIIDPMHLMPDLYRLNNNIRTTGILRKYDPLRLQFLYAFDDPDKRTIIYAPVVNWTREDGFMAGLSINNAVGLHQKVDYFVIPFYTFKNPGIAGFGRVAYNITPYDKLIRLATISLEGSQFGAPGNQNYHTAKAGIDIYFKSSNTTNALKHEVYGNYIAATDLYKIDLSEKAVMSSFFQFGYMMERRTVINPFNLLVSLESNSSYQKTSAEFNYRYSYYGKKNGMDMRFFAGTMLKNNPDAQFYKLAPSGRGGREQYLYQGTYPDRFRKFPDTFFSRQMTTSEGGLVSPLNDSIGYSNWLISASFSSSFPGKAGKIPVKPFMNILLNDRGNGTGHNSPLFFEAGFKAGIWNIFEIYVPLVVSGNIESVSGSFKDRIRFVLNLDSFFRGTI